MSAPVSSQTSSQVKSPVIFQNCLIVSRHQLLPLQAEDVQKICVKTSQVPEIPTEQKQLSELLKQYDAVVGTLPLPLIAQVLQLKKSFVSFSMKSLGTFQSLEEAKQVEAKYPGRVAVLPGKPGEPVRATLYLGLSLIKEIKIVSEPIVSHPE